MASKAPKLLEGLAFPAMEPLSLPPAGGSASRSRASQDKGLPGRLSGAGLEILRRYPPALQHRRGQDGAEPPSRARANSCAVQHSKLRSNGTLSASASTAIAFPRFRRGRSHHVAEA